MFPLWRTLMCLKGQDTSLLSDSLVLSRNALSQGAVHCRAVVAAADAARRCGVVSCRATPGRRRKASREQAVALGRTADGSDGGGWDGAVSDRG